MSQRYFTLTIILAALKLVLPFLLQDPAWELHRDEYLYYEQGRHVDFGYLENPPMICLLAWISSLFGGSFFWIKLWPVLFGALTLLVVAQMIRALGGGLYALLVAGLGMIFTAYLRIHFLFQPNSLEIFFWTLAAYFLVLFINTRHNKYLYLLSTALALGWWSKYSVLFFIAALIISLLLTRYRKLFLRGEFWKAAGLGLLMVLPNILWQYTHNWPLVHHMDELRETQLRYINRSDFIKEQILLLLPVLFVWIGGLIWFLRRREYKVLGLIYLSVVVLLMLGSGKGYYTLGAYPMLLAAGGVWLERATVKRRWLRYVNISIILILSLPFVPILLPMQKPAVMAAFNQKYKLEGLGILKWEDQQNHPLQQDFADMLGWQALAQKSERIFNQLPPAVQQHTVVYSRNYGQAGALKYYAQSEEFRSKVFTDNGTFLLWIPDSLYFEHLLFIGRHLPDPDDEVFQHFRQVTVMDSINNPLSRQYGDKIILFQGADSLAHRLANKGLREMKQKFDR
jgi:4-amino-4-deoxy-L-arabinose transferase-like glycosyltransferase